MFQIIFKQLKILIYFHILKNKYLLNPQVVFCGSDIGYKRNLERYVKQKGLSENFSFFDFVEDEHLPYLYLNAYTLRL